MVPIKKGQAVPDSVALRVLADDGEYADTDLILCEEIDQPGVASAMLQAQFVQYGSLIYRYSTPESLGEAIHAVDPKSKHDAVTLYKEQRARDYAREHGTLEPEDPAEAADALAGTPETEAGKEEEPHEPEPEQEPDAPLIVPDEESIVEPIPEPSVPTTTPKTREEILESDIFDVMPVLDPVSGELVVPTEPVIQIDPVVPPVDPSLNTSTTTPSS